MTRFLLGLWMIGSLGCGVSEPSRSTLDESEATAASTIAPSFMRCLQGATCVPDTQCTGLITNVPCGPGGLHCCNPIACAGQCIQASFCDLHSQIVDPEAICPNGGICCITPNLPQ